MICFLGQPGPLFGDRNTHSSFKATIGRSIDRNAINPHTSLATLRGLGVYLRRTEMKGACVIRLDWTR